jgi:hypothetical protein
VKGWDEYQGELTITDQLTLIHKIAVLEPVKDGFYEMV